MDAARLSDYEWAVSIITLGELRLGVLQAGNVSAAARRLSTYQLAHRFEPIGINEAVADEWALLVSRLRAAKRRASINHGWIAATALAHDIPIVTHDDDFDAMPGVEIIRL